MARFYIKHVRTELKPITVPALAKELISTLQRDKRGAFHFQIRDLSDHRRKNLRATLAGPAFQDDRFSHAAGFGNAVAAGAGVFSRLTPANFTFEIYG